MQKRLIVSEEDDKLLVILEDTKVICYPYQTKNIVEYTPLAVIPSDRKLVAEVIADSISRVHNLPISYEYMENK
jgi:hypothetical protein